MKKLKKGKQNFLKKKQKEKGEESNNSFDRGELLKWFVYCHECWWCEKHHWNCFHHIDGRSKKYSSSILNAAPLSNEECHLPIHAKLKKKENVMMLLEKTLTWLLAQGYKLTKLDSDFIESRQQIYSQIIDNKQKSY